MPNKVAIHSDCLQTATTDYFGLFVIYLCVNFFLVEVKKSIYRQCYTFFDARFRLSYNPVV